MRSGNGLLRSPAYVHRHHYAKIDACTRAKLSIHAAGPVRVSGLCFWDIISGDPRGGLASRSCPRHAPGVAAGDVHAAGASPRTRNLRCKGPAIDLTIDGLAGPAFVLEHRSRPQHDLFRLRQRCASAPATRSRARRSNERCVPFHQRFPGSRRHGRPPAPPGRLLVVSGSESPAVALRGNANRRVVRARNYDGLIGQDFLRNFDVYLDYPHSKVYLVPNDRFRARWGG